MAMFTTGSAPSPAGFLFWEGIKEGGINLMEMTLREWGFAAIAILAVIMLIVTQIDLLRTRRQLRKEKENQGLHSQE